jgi:hypothetical protein
VTELVVDARILVYRVAVGQSTLQEHSELDARLLQANTLIAPSCEFLRSYRMLTTLSTEGFLTPSNALRLSMLVCESGVELRPMWPWDVARVSALRCHPADAWCIAIAESLGVPLLTRNRDLMSVGAVCPIEIY